MQNKVYIIIVTYNGMQWLSKCLKSTKDFPVIIVDNCSNDGTLDFIKSNFPEILLLKQKINLGFGAANNIGISYALNLGAEYVFLLNQDAYLQKNCIEGLIDVHKKDNGFGILSPFHLNGDGTNLDERFSYYINYNSNPLILADYILNNNLKKVYEVPFVNAAGWLVTKKCLEMVGGFDPIFFHYGEDSNYCQRALYFEFKIGVVPRFFIHHDRQNRAQLVDNLKERERLLKIQFADLNLRDLDSFKKIIKDVKSRKRNALLNFRIRKFRTLLVEEEYLKKIANEIIESRNINSTEGFHYLN